MFRIIQNLLLLAALIVSQGVLAQKGYHIIGTCDQCVDGDKVYLCNMEGFFVMVPVDSTVVKNGKFEFTGEYDGCAMRFISPMHEGTDINFATVMLENADFTVTMKKGQAEEVKGGPSTALYAEYEAGLEKVYGGKTRELYGIEGDSTRTEAERAAARAELAIIDKRVGQYKYDFVMNHIPSPISDLLLTSLGRDCTDEQIDAILAKMEQSGKTYQNYKAIMAERAATAATAIGSKYTDLAFANPDGNIIKVSDYVSKNKYTMIDFWASWCGPCIKEMPWVVKAYEQYHAKGFEVIGVSLDNKKDAWLKAIAKHNMPWPHMSDLKGWACEAAIPYNVKAIPANVLIDQNGTIVAKNLREQELLDKLAELF